MAANTPVRVATAPELVKYRQDKQFSVPGLAIQHPTTVYTARINQTFGTLDRVPELTYVYGGSGTLGSVLVGMTMFVGSKAGLYDKGMVRIRQIPSATVFYISETSDIQFAENDYLTVINAFSIWPRDTAMYGETVNMDYDIEFGDYQNGGVIPRIGPLVSVLNRTSGTVTFTPPSPALSAAYDGSTISSYLYAFPGATSTANLTSGTGTANATYETAGEYRWSCAITDSLGRVTTSYRWVFIDPSAVAFEIIDDVTGDFQDGGWSFSVRLFQDVTKAVIYDRSLITLYSNDYYNGAVSNIGKLANYTNIICSGWVDGETIEYDSEKGSVTFTVRGPSHWLQKIRAFPFEILDSSAAPTSWKEIQEMTVDKALAHVLFWLSTAPLVMDCFFTGDTNRVAVFSQPSGTLYDQIDSIAMSIFAKPVCNNYGQLFIEIDTQVAAAAVKNALTVVMDITESEWPSPLEIERSNSGDASMVELSAVTDYDGTTSVQVYSRAPGLSGKTFGEIKTFDNYVVTDQDECNRIAGALLFVQNNEYMEIDIEFQSIIRLFDVAPRMYATITIPAADTPRGVAITSQRLIPRNIVYQFDSDTGKLVTKVSFEFDISKYNGATYDDPPSGVTYIPPSIADELPDYELDEIPDLDFPSFDTTFPPFIPSVTFPPCTQTRYSAFTSAFDTNEIRGDATDRIASIYFPCTLHGAGGLYAKSHLLINYTPYEDAVTLTNIGVYAVKSGARVSTAALSLPYVTVQGVSNILKAEFSGAAPLLVDGFELELASGLGATVTYVPLGIIASGSVAATDATGDAITMVSGQYYCIDETGGSWETVPPTPDRHGMMLIVAGVYTDNVIHSYFWSGSFARKFYVAPGSSMQALVNDSPPFDNTGSMSYVVRNARADGRRIIFSAVTIRDVCSP